MDTPNVRDDEVVIDNHGVVLGNDDDDVVLEPTPGNDDDGVLEPTSGRLFKTEKEFIYYYKQYGRHTGFSIMTQISKREDDESVRYVTLGCTRGGKAMKHITNISKPRLTTKIDCKARINVVLVDSVIFIATIQLDINDKADICMTKSFNALVVDAGGFEKLPVIEKDARNYIDKARHLRLGKGGADALRGYFERMQYKNDEFYSSMDLDDDDRLKNVFWADARSRAAYEYFGDIVTFDTIYLTNRYGMSFAPFVGVNHHGQSILLGAGLISSENTEIFIWLFDTCLKCMDGRVQKLSSLIKSGS
ncbi:hypothetical protein F2P56_020094 [Juglans regia]|uniref:Protein FAR1-RELATED SEQUENCE n=2 Tax=Juglans regia TaxID=51240 RepID=A0A833X5N8_JUGRE|nr:protein FAR-RED IMPAIRED RESPONSE 1-like [Juglans regia]KAF5460211.1 hypothetical protein F2P56_020094 [Juglans regia]